MLENVLGANNVEVTRISEPASMSLEELYGDFKENDEFHDGVLTSALRKAVNFISFLLKLTFFI